MFGDQITSLIRTNLAVWIPAAAALVAEYGVDLPVEPLTVTATAGAISLYYTAARALEDRWPIFGRLLGSSRAPHYPKAPHARA